VRPASSESAAGQHGALNAIFLPHVMRFNAGVRPDAEARIREALGLSASADMADALQDLNNALGIPANLSVLGLSNEQADGIVANALIDIARAVEYTFNGNHIVQNSVEHHKIPYQHNSVTIKLFKLSPHFWKNSELFNGFI
jgi:alcohol dehydrogenase class IV